MKVKKYNIKKLVETLHPTHTTFREDDIVVLIGTNGIIVVDSEGVHTPLATIENKYEIEVITPATSGTLKIMPDAIMKSTVKELMKADSEEVELGEYVRKFGSRLEQNYAILLKSIKQIGLDPKDYPRS